MTQFADDQGQVDANMTRAHKRGAVLTEKFYWRKNVTKGMPISHLFAELISSAHRLGLSSRRL